jgi:hypothetical protein
MRSGSMPTAFASRPWRGGGGHVRGLRAAIALFSETVREYVLWVIVVSCARITFGAIGFDV